MIWGAKRRFLIDSFSPKNPPKNPHNKKMVGDTKTLKIKETKELLKKFEKEETNIFYFKTKLKLIWEL